MSLLIEKSWPYILSVLIVASWFFYWEKPFPSDAGDLLGATGNVSAVLVGFLITAQAIVLGLTNTPLFSRLSDTGYDKVFFRYIYEAEIAGVLLLCCSIFGFFASDDVGATPAYFQILWISSFLLSLTLFFRVVMMMFSFLKKV